MNECVYTRIAERRTILHENAILFITRRSITFFLLTTLMVVSRDVLETIGNFRKWFPRSTSTPAFELPYPGYKKRVLNANRRKNQIFRLSQNVDCGRANVKTTYGPKRDGRFFAYRSVAFRATYTPPSPALTNDDLTTIIVVVYCTTTAGRFVILRECNVG